MNIYINSIKTLDYFMQAGEKMRRVIMILLLLSLTAFIINVRAELNVEPQYLDQAPLLGGKNAIFLSWYTGNIKDSQNFEKNLFDNFALYLSRSGVPDDIIPEILGDVSSITPDAKLTEKNFNPDKDKFKAEISYNMLRVKELGRGIQVLTPPWKEAEEIDLSSSEVRSLINECGSNNDMTAIKIVPARDMSDLISINDASVQVSNALNNGHSLVVQNVIVNPEERNAAILVERNNIASQSSGLGYMVLGNNQNDVNCVLTKISDASGVSVRSVSSSSVPADLPSSPIPPVPELSPIILVSIGLLGLLLVLSKCKKN